ncbi:methyltransferase domain-containing protein [Thermodesulfobacteriota bacterium]
MNELNKQVSYKVDQVSANIRVELNRLKAQVELFWDKEIKTYCDLGLTDGLKILECGSGPGYLTERLVSHFPNIFITGLEIDPFLIEVANTQFQEKGLDRHEFFQGSVLEMEFPDESFDFVIARLLLEHLPEPAIAAKEIHRVLKPGGKVVIIDNDFEVHLNTYPYIPELSLLYDAYCRARINEGGNPKIGRELPYILKKSGFLNVDIETIIAHSEVVGDEIFLRSEGSGIPAKLVEDGYLSREILDNLTGKWFEMLQEDNHSVFRQLFVVGGEKSLSQDVSVVNGGEQGETASPLVREEVVPLTEVREAQLENTITSPTSMIEIEKKISEIWSNVLGISDIGINDNFFELGGNSLLAVRIVKDIKKILTENISVTQLFQYPTIGSLTSNLNQGLNNIPKTRAFEDRAKMRRKAINRRRRQAVDN